MQQNPVPPNPPQPDQQTSKQVSGSANDRKPPLAAGYRPPDQALNCPRCDSPNTKFCYYNNYSLTQPRHFCKTCRRYWTKGGALRNVPIGGGCRKNKRSKSAQRTSAPNSDDPNIPSLTESAAGKYFPAMDFGLPFSRLQGTGFLNHLISFGDLSLSSSSSSSSSSSCSSAAPLAVDSLNPVSLLGFNYPVSLKHGENGSGCGGSNSGFQCLDSQNSHGSIAASIESLSTINADLHWRLQQQRLAMYFGGENQKETGVSAESMTCQQPNLVEPRLLDYQGLQPISFQNLESCKNGGSCNNPRKGSVHDHGLNRESATEWLLESSYNNNSSSSNNNNNNSNNSTWSGIQTWTDLQQYSALP